jgi:hypothetical protein
MNGPLGDAADDGSGRGNCIVAIDEGIEDI